MNFAVMMMGIALFTACTKDESEHHGTVPVAVSNGVYMVCSGNSRAGIDGSLSYFDYNKNAGVVDIFKSGNGKSLGQTPNDAIRYGNKLYIVGSGENKVFVTNANSLKLLTTIDMTDLMGEQDGVNPRRIAVDNGNIYVSTYGGYVAAIDTVNFELQKKYKAGSYPEGVAVANGLLYVANSDYGNGNASISVINLSTGAETPITDENIRNPQDIVTAGTDIYYLDYGQYDDSWNQTDAGVYRIRSKQVTKIIPDATMMTAAGYSIYTINAPYGSGKVTYSVFSLSDNSVKNLTPAGIDSPAAIGVDPVSGDVAIASYKMNGEYADYAANAYVNIYDYTLSAKKATFDCGVGPQRFVYNVGLAIMKY